MQALHCRRCKRVLALTDGVALVITPCRFTRTVTLACEDCGARREWAPIKITARVLVLA